MKVRSYRDLEVWQKGMVLAEACYSVTKPFPKDEMFGLTSQIRRAAVSVPANIAEGQGRFHTKEFIQHLGIARGSINELETHLELANRVGLVPLDALNRLVSMSDEIGRMIWGLRRRLDDRSANGSDH